MKQIRIGAYDYSLMVQEDLLSDRHETLLGEIKYNQQEIRIELNQTQQSKAIVLLHEVVHGILSNSGIKQNEKTVDQVSQGIAMFLRDNVPNAWEELLKMFEGAEPVK